MSAPTYIKGSQLSQDARREALNRWVHRFTGEHRPSWAQPNHQPHYKTDAECSAECGNYAFSYV